MRIEYSEVFLRQLDAQTRYIARDKPAAAKRFRKNVMREVRRVTQSPFSNRQSVFFEDRNYRDLVFKGFKVTYFIDEKKPVVLVIGLVNMQRGLSEG